MIFRLRKPMVRSIIPILACLSILSGALPASDTAASTASRNDRLAGLCRVWGAIKYFHPSLAYKRIDWDNALIQTIPDVRDDAPPPAYKAAVGKLLGYIQDPNTEVIDESYRRMPSKIRQEDTVQPYMITTDNDFAVIVAADYSQFIGDIYKADQLHDLFVDATRSRGVVIDIRRLDIPDDSAADRAACLAFRAAFLKAFPVLLHDDLELASGRRRVHIGYIPQGTSNSNDYSAAFEYRNAEILTAAGGEFESVPIVFVVNERSGVLFDLLAGLQTAHRAVVVYEGYFDHEGGLETYDMALPDSVTVRMRTNELIKPDGTVGFDPDLVLPFTTDTTIMASPPIELALSILDGTRVVPPVIGIKVSPIAPNIPEKDYVDMVYPDRDYRLLALFRLWNVIEYFSPYSRDSASSWDSTLPEFIPSMEAASDSLEYVMVIAELTARLNDSRVTVETPVLRHYFGVFFPPIVIQYVAGKTVVVDIRQGIQNPPDIHPGDIIVAIDAESIDVRRERLARLLSASTPQSLQHKVDSVLLGGRNGSAVRLTIQHNDGSRKDVILKRDMQYHKLQRWGKVFGTLPSGMGYVDLCRLPEDLIDTAMGVIKDTPGLILDLRGDIDSSSFPLVSYFTKAEKSALKTCIPESYGPDPNRFGERCKVETISPANGRAYDGRVIALIDADAGGQAERLGMMLAAAGVVFIGTPTPGSAGDITSTVLPGGISVSFTGSDIRYPDGRCLRRTGIQPDIVVEPTIASVREERDDILDAAVEYLSRPTGRRDSRK